MFYAYPSTKNYTSWMKPQDFFTLKGIPMPRLLTKINTPVLNENLTPIAVAQPNTILGRLIMSMKTGKGEFLQFQTVDNTLRWVDKRFIQLQEQS
jgi:ADP-dependent phosphofructokinase/glucokinase